MDTIIRAVVIYLFLLILLRASGGKRSLAQITTLDFLLLLIISEVTQQALTTEDYSLTNSMILILSLVGIDIVFTLLKQRFRKLDLLIEGAPLIVVKDGKLLKKRLRNSRLDKGDILQSARRSFGLERLGQIKYAVLERDGGLTIIPQRDQFVQSLSPIEPAPASTKFKPKEAKP